MCSLWPCLVWLKWTPESLVWFSLDGLNPGLRLQSRPNNISPVCLQRWSQFSIHFSFLESTSSTDRIHSLHIIAFTHWVGCLSRFNWAAGKPQECIIVCQLFLFGTRCCGNIWQDLLKVNVYNLSVDWWKIIYITNVNVLHLTGLINIQSCPHQNEFCRFRMVHDYIYTSSRGN